MATQKFVEYYLNSISIEPWVTGAAQPKLNQKALHSIPIPLPPLPEQQRIVAELVEERALVAASKALVEKLEAKVRERVARVWGVAEPVLER
ncbi:MAG: restriction endonuclease subunit S [Flavobacteriales bacterium]|nr:restriction endonuclease subunit S [Flavobacteriales bacterium]MCC6939795.1 restriction endonuclease subunit S [Flavobacteriales bacterium]